MRVSSRSGGGATAACASLALALGAAAGCADVGGPAAIAAALPIVDPRDQTGPGNLDMLFVIDDGPGMEEMQQKLNLQIPVFLNRLESYGGGMPNLHLGVITGDMGVGAASDSADVLAGCSETGDGGALQVMPYGCPDSTLAPGATYVSSVDNITNFTAPLSDVVQCILPTGGQGCAFQRPLAAIARALGADGLPPPDANAGFLRADAGLAIFILTNRDDCSAETSALYALNGGHDNLTNALGPLAQYRCNEFGHLCADPRGDGTIDVQPPEMPPADAEGTAASPAYELTDCTSNEAGGLLTPVRTFVNRIRALKSDPDHRIAVASIAGPATPYTVEWVPATGNDVNPSGELWPRVEHACGATGADLNPAATQVSSDGSFGDPAVRLAEFVRNFGANGAVASICDTSYAAAMQPMLAHLDQLDDARPFPPATGTGGAIGSGGRPGIEGVVAGTGGRPGAGGASSGFGGDPSTAVTGGASGTGFGGGPGSGSGTGGLNGQSFGGVGGDGLLEGGCGGCDVGASGAGAGGLVLALCALAVIGRRRRPTGAGRGKRSKADREFVGPVTTKANPWLPAPKEASCQRHRARHRPAAAPPSWS